MLTGAQHKQLLEALISAFPSIDELRMLAKFELGVNLDEVADAGNLRIAAFKLVTWAESSGYIDALIRGAASERPGNSNIKKLVASAHTWNLEAVEQMSESPAFYSADTNTPTSIDIFLSYSHRDDSLMRQLCAELRRAGFSVWINDGLVPGTLDWQSAIEEAIRQARCLVLLMTPDAKKSKWVNSEVSIAADIGKQIFPVLAVGDIPDAVPLLLYNTQHVDIRSDFAFVAQKLLPTLHLYLAKNSSHDLSVAIDTLLRNDDGSPKAPEDSLGNESLSSRAHVADRTGLIVTIRMRMSHVPTGIYHLLNEREHPLVEVVLENSAHLPRRIRVYSSIDGYSAEAIEMFELDSRGKPGATRSVTQLPTLFPGRVRHVTELTRASVVVLVEEIGGSIETHETLAVWLLARNSVPVAVRDPSSGALVDLSRYLGAFVTPRAVMPFLRIAERRHPMGRLTGYQSDITVQVRVIFDALKVDAGIIHVNSPITFNPDESAQGQRIRLPRETLNERLANCIDGTLLFASLLEAASINPAIIIVPDHAFVGWEKAPKSGSWDYLETTMIGTNNFEEACKIGQQRASFWEKKQAEAPDNDFVFRHLSLRELRTTYGITPIE